MDNFESYTLRNGAKMPSVALGTWMSAPGEVEGAVKVAISNGFRHIDTAQLYENEGEIGIALEECINEGVVTREDMFITTKLAGIHMSPDRVRSGTLESLSKLRTSYVDLYLIHFPIALVNTGADPVKFFPLREDGTVLTDDVDYLDTWKEMEKLVDEGLVKAIGLSNFNKSQVARVYNNARIKPANLQVECHGYFPQVDLADYCLKKNISFAAYGPIGSPGRASVQRTSDLILLEDPVVVGLAEKYKRTPAQILMRNLLQRQIIVLPKSTNKERIISNIKLFDFKLSDEDMTAIAGLESKGRRLFEFYLIFGASSYTHVHFPFHDELPPKE